MPDKREEEHHDDDDDDDNDDDVLADWADDAQIKDRAVVGDTHGSLGQSVQRT